MTKQLVLVVFATLTLTLTCIPTLVQAGGGQRGSNAFPYGNPCLTDSMYYEDAKYVYDDIQAGRFNKLFIKFHNCA
jgi:hypothetical protein